MDVVNLPESRVSEEEQNVIVVLLWSGFFAPCIMSLFLDSEMFDSKHNSDYQSIFK